MGKRIKVGVVQDSPVFFNKVATLEKVRELVNTHAREGCKLLVFPESFVPGYPRGFDFGAKIGSRTEAGKELFAKYRNESVDLEGEDRTVLEEISSEYGVYLVIGITEMQRSNGSLYCSMLYISPDSGLLGVHRKIKPTGTERVIWAEAGGESLVTFDTKIGRLGGLICWENYMPLARMAMYRKGVELYIAPTADSRQEWTTTMKHIALEGRCFVLGCNQYFRKEYYPDVYRELVAESHEDFCNGGSIIVSPSGKVLSGPLFGSEGVLIADIDLDEIAESKLDFDPNGHYNRPDIFRFEVSDQPETQKE
jgi:nitrilase